MPGVTVNTCIDAPVENEINPITFHSKEDFDRLQKSIYSVDWHRQLRIAPWSEGIKEYGLNGRWLPVILTETQEWAAILETRKLILTRELTPEVVLKVTTPSSPPPINLRIKNRIKTRHTIPRDMNGNHFYIFDVEPV